jgi:hypothetical protein
MAAAYILRTAENTAVIVSGSFLRKNQYVKEVFLLINAVQAFLLGAERIVFVERIEELG